MLLIIAFLCQRWLCTCASALRYAYVACLVLVGFSRCTVQLWKLIGLSRYFHLSGVLMCHKMINFY